MTTGIRDLDLINQPSGDRGTDSELREWRRFNNNSSLIGLATKIVFLDTRLDDLTDILKKDLSPNRVKTYST